MEATAKFIENGLDRASIVIGVIAVVILLAGLPLEDSWIDSLLRPILGRL